MSTRSFELVFAHHRVVKLLSRTKSPLLPQGNTREMELKVGSMCGTKAVKKKITVTEKVTFTAL